MDAQLRRRDLFSGCLAGARFLVAANSAPWRPIVVSVNVMFDQGARSGKGLLDTEISLFKRYQEEVRREYSTSGILFSLSLTEGAYLRAQGYSQIPDKFLSPKAINLFVTETLGYDIDKDRTGACSTGPRPRGRDTSPDAYYKIFLGLKDAGEKALAHEYAHHFTLDTRRHPTMLRNSWADLRNDYWLWRQRHGVPIPHFRACANSDWTRVPEQPITDHRPPTTSHRQPATSYQPPATARCATI